MITYSFLQHYWWFLISLLAGILVFLFFVQGGQTLLHSLAKTENEKRLLVNAIGKKWEFTYTTLVTFGGAFFASFPIFYSTSFGGAYWVWMLILFCFVMQAVSYEYQNKKGNVYGVKFYRTLLFINGLGGTFLIGAAVATFFTGSAFSVGQSNITDVLAPTVSQWESPLHGLEALFDYRNWLLGLAVFFLARTLGVLFFKNRVHNEDLESRFNKSLLWNAVPFLVFFLAFLIIILFGKGFAVDPTTKAVSLEPMKYFHNLIAMPIVLIVLLIGVVGVLYGIGYTLLKPEWKKGIWFAGVGTTLTVTMLLLLAGYNNTPYYPSTFDLNSSLTIANSSSSFFTLKVMSVVSLIIPIVLVYIFFAWRSLEKKQISVEEINDEENHAY